MPTTVLTLDLGTSATKATLWRGGELRALARAPVVTAHPQPGWAEQDPDDWWASVVSACAELRSLAGPDYGDVEAIGCSAARETFALFDAALRPLGPGILWSDRRAGREAEALGDPDAFRATTGVVLDAGACAAKLAWVTRHAPDAFGDARWVLAPRDLVVATLTGAVVTDETLASRTGLCALGGDWLAGAVEAYGARLAPILASATVVGTLTPDAADALALPRSARVVVGAGDRPCEAIGTGASALAPMVSWGTTANVSAPYAGPARDLPAVAAVSRGALGGFLVEAGLSAAGAAIGWLSSLTGRTHDELLAAAAAVAPGAAGVVALPWFAGARGPWWRPDAHAAFLGLTDAHGPGEITRAVMEGIAFDVARCLDLVAPGCTELSLAGAGAGNALWRGVLGGATGRAVVRRAVDDAASVGARLVVAAALGEPLDVEAVNPVSEREIPEAGLVTASRAARAASDAAAAAVLGSGPP